MIKLLQNSTKFICLFIVLSLNQVSGQKQIFTVADYGIKANKSESIASKLNEVIQIIKNKQKENEKIILKFEKGTYYFDAEDCLKKEVYISNHDQVGIRAIGMLLDKMHNTIIEGNGAEFICRGRMVPIAVLNSENIEFRNFSIDFENPMMAQLEVVENNANGIKFRPAPWVKWKIKNGKFNYYGKGWDYSPWLGVAFDEKNKNLIYKTSDISINVEGAIDNGDGTVTAPNWKCR